MIPFLIAVGSIASADAQVPVGFEVTSVKQGIRYSEWMARMRVTPGSFKGLAAMEVSGRRVHIAGISMKGLINKAYGIDTRLIVGPPWVTEGDITYELDALMPEGATTDQMPAMFQSLLAERFHFSFHRETVSQPGYALVRSKSLLKLMPPGMVDPSACREWEGALNGQRCTKLDIVGDERVQTVIWRDSEGGSGKIQMHGSERQEEFYAITMEDLARHASAVIGLNSTGALVGPEPLSVPMATVVNRTGLEGRWRLVINREMGAQTKLPSFVASLNRLGLGLERMSAPVEKIVIDRVDKDPTPN